jgi:hypothetical protein
MLTLMWGRVISLNVKLTNYVEMNGINGTWFS